MRHNFRRISRTAMIDSAICAVVIGVILLAFSFAHSSRKSRSMLDPQVSAMLSDGVITEAELSISFWMVMSCLDDAGLPYSNVVWHGDGRVPQWQASIGPYPEGFSPGASTDPYLDCDNRFGRAISDLWGQQHAMSNEEIEAADSMVIACANSVGIPANTFAEFSQLRVGLADDLALAAALCVEEAYR